MSEAKEELKKEERHSLVSIIIVSRNAKNTIKRCLDSVVNQTYRNIELVVVDSSNDETVHILEEYKNRSPFPFRIIYQEPKGVGIARNTGIENAKGDVLVLVDADCWIDKEFVEKIVKPFSESGKVLSVYTGIVQIASTGIFPTLIGVYERVMHYSDVRKTKSEKISTHVVRKNLYDFVGLYDPNLKSGEDVELFNRLFEKKEELLDQGFEFASVLDTNFYEEKQELGFLEYYKKCIWYGNPLANSDYFKSDLTKNSVKLVLGLYYTMLLPFVALSVIINLNIVYIFLTLIPFIGMYVYIITKSISIKKFQLLVLLMPVLLFYKFICLFIGFLEALLK